MVVFVFSVCFTPRKLSSHLPYKNQPTTTPKMIIVPGRLAMIIGLLWMFKPYKTHIIPAKKLKPKAVMEMSFALFLLKIL